VATSWRNSADVLREIIRQQGADPDRVESPESTWRAFCGFLLVAFDGLDTESDSDADGFIVQWGRNSWNDGLPSLSFTRRFAVDVRAEWVEADWYQPEYWQVDLVMVFPDHPTLADLGELNTQDSGFYFERPGPEFDNALREALWEFGQYPTLQALWASTPLRSTVHLMRAD
jgi:hypothetical protein